MKCFRCLSAIVIGTWLLAAPLLAQESESRPDTGIIYGQQYVNSYFGFSYRFPAAWSATAGRANMASRIYQLLTATPSGGGDGRYVVVQAERLWQNGNVKTGRDFLVMSVEMLTGPSTGFEALPGDKRYTFGGREFDRVDLRSRATPGASTVHQALVATVVRDYAVTFQFKASTEAELEELVSTLQSLSFLDSGQAAATPSRPVPQPGAASPIASAPAAAALSPVHVASQSATQSTPQVTPTVRAVTPSASVAAPSAAVSAGPATSAPAVTSLPAARSAQPGTTAASSTSPRVSAPAQSTPQADSPNTSAGAGAPSTFIKMATAPHTISGDTLPAAQLETPPQPLVKAPPKSDPTTKTAVMQAVMPAQSATMSPAALNPNPAQPVISSQTTAAVQPATLAQPAASTQSIPAAPVAPARKPAYIAHTEITRVQISGETLESYVIRKVPAVYPLLARQARIEGLVVLTIVVDEKGEVQEVKALSGPALLARSAEDALRHWRFKPIMVDGKPTQIESRVSMNFQFPH